MVKKLRKLPNSTKASNKAPTVAETDLQPSKLAIFDIPDHLLIDSPDNPQEMDDATMDELVEGMRENERNGEPMVDEPLHVIRMYDDDGIHTGEYMITSGHHRRKGGRIAGVTEFPCVIRKDMDDAARKIALVRRNQLRGNMNSKKFTALFREVAPTLGQEVTKRLMGFTKESAFKAVMEKVSKSLPEGARKQLDEAKEDVKSIDDMSSVLNGIFRKEGSKVKHGYMVFSYGGKQHHYFQIDKDTNELLKTVEATMQRENRTASDVFGSLLGGRLTVAPKTKTKLKVKRNGNGKTA